jgi:DNA mismatch repair ATPase MutL
MAQIKNGRLNFTVRDTGSGIEKEELDSIIDQILSNKIDNKKD